MNKSYIQYYNSQVGGALSDIGPTFYIPLIQQRGSGIGSFFSNLFKYLRPVISKSLGVIKNQSLKTGAAILKEAQQKPFREVLKEQSKLAVQDLATKGLEKLVRKTDQEGSGCRIAIKRKNSSTVSHSKRKFARKHTPAQRQQQRKKNNKIKIHKKTRTQHSDIFNKRKLI